MNGIGNWLQTHLGLPTWLFGLVIVPLLVWLALSAGRRYLLTRLFRDPAQSRQRRILRSVSLYGGLVLGRGATHEDGVLVLSISASAR